MWRHPAELPQGRKAARVGGLWRVRGGSFMSVPIGRVELCTVYDRAVPPLPARDVRRGHRPGARHRAADDGAAQEPGQPRLPVLRPARLRQDHQRPHPRPLPELRAGPDGHPLRQVPRPASTWPAAAPAASTSSRSTRPATAASTTPATCANGRPSRPVRDRYKIFIIDEAHMVTHAGLQRPAQDRRGAAGARQVRLRDHRAGEGHRHHPLAHPPLPVPAGAAGAAAGVPRASSATQEGVAGGAGRAAPRRPGRRRARSATRCRCSTSSWPAPARTASTTSSPSPLLGLHRRRPARRRRRRAVAARTPPRSSASSTGSSRPATTPAASSRTCSSACATSSSSPAVPDGAHVHPPRHAGGPARPDAEPGARFGRGRALPRRGRRQHRAHRDDRRHLAAAAAGTAVRPHPAARLRADRARHRGPDRPRRAAFELRRERRRSSPFRRPRSCPPSPARAEQTPRSSAARRSSRLQPRLPRQPPRGTGRPQPPAPRRRARAPPLPLLRRRDEPVREPLTAPRVSTSDWPMDEAAAASKPAPAPSQPAAAQPAPSASTPSPAAPPVEPAPAAATASEAAPRPRLARLPPQLPAPCPALPPARAPTSRSCAVPGLRSCRRSPRSSAARGRSWNPTPRSAISKTMS